MKRIALPIFIMIISVFLMAEKKTYPNFERLIKRYEREISQKQRLFEKYRKNILEFRELEYYDVNHYDLDIIVDFEQQMLVGSNTVKLTFTESDVSSITLHAEDNLNINAVTENNEAIEFQHSEGYLECYLQNNYNSNDELEISVNFEAFPDSRLNDGVKFQEHSGEPIAFTMVSPMGARKWWPCKDTPADKADSLDLKITFPEEYVCAANGVKLEEYTDGQGNLINEWQESYPIATYLTSFAITNYEVQETDYSYNGETMPIRNYIYPEQYEVSVDLFSETADMIDFYTTIYGEYPFLSEKYGHAVCSNLGALAMEHQTCTSFESGYISDPESEYTVAHELSHQWAGDCLSIDGWAHVWLKEGFARYSEALWAEYQFGETALIDYMTNLDTGSALDPPLYRDPDGSPGDIFNIVIYSKGAWTQHMLRKVVGSENYFQITEMLMTDPDFRYGNFNTESLKNFIEENLNIELDWFFEQWYWQEGRPSYDFTVYSSDEITDSLKVTIFSKGSHSEVFTMPIEYETEIGVGESFVYPDFNYLTLPTQNSNPNINWDPDNWVLDYGFTEKIPEVVELERQRDGSVLLLIKDFFDEQIEGFDIYRSEDGNDFIKINNDPVSGNYYLDEGIELNQSYVYKIRAVWDSNNGYRSKFSNTVELEAVEFTLENGILIVDGSLDYGEETPFPSDDEHDGFYDTILGSYSYEEWDIAEQGEPEISHLGSFSTVIWHTEDLSNTPFSGDFDLYSQYLLEGGNLIVTGWKLMNNIEDEFVRELLGAQNIEFSTNPDFTAALALADYPVLTVDPDKIELESWNNCLSFVNHFNSSDSSISIYGYDSVNDNADWEGDTCAVKMISDNYQAFVFGFPFYFFETEQVTQLVSQILSEFGETALNEDNLEEITDYGAAIYPNPIFNGSKNPVLSFSNPTPGLGEISIYNIKGKKVADLYKGEIKAGIHEFAWDARNRQNEKVADGIYLFRIKISDRNVVKKCVIIR